MGTSPASRPRHHRFRFVSSAEQAKYDGFSPGEQGIADGVE